MSEDKKPGKGVVAPEYYNKDYFETGSKRLKDHVTGKEKVWGYHGTDWAGNYFIVQGLLSILRGELGSVLDVGCGQGSFTDYTLRWGLRAKGYDFSKFAIESAHHYAKNHVFILDVCKGLPDPDESYDLVFCSDLLEHLPKTKEPFVLQEFYRVTRKWVFLQFPIANNEKEIFDAEIHNKSHPLYAHCMIAGHTNLSTRPWWDALFSSEGFKIRNDLVVDFRAAVNRAVIANWHNIVILEKDSSSK